MKCHKLLTIRLQFCQIPMMHSKYFIDARAVLCLKSSTMSQLITYNQVFEMRSILFGSINSVVFRHLYTYLN